MNRRNNVLALLALGAAPLRALAQRKPSVPARIGILSPGKVDPQNPLIECFLAGLRDAGWVDGRNITIDFSGAENVAIRYPTLTAELVSQQPDLIVANGTPSAQAMKRATATIPVVIVAVSAPVKSGIVPSLARPGGNITRVSNFLPATSGKLIETLRLANPKLARFGVLHNPDNGGKLLEVEELQAAGKSIGVAIHPFAVRTAGEVEAALPAALKAQCDALIVLQEGVIFANKARIVELAAKHRLPAIYQIREYVEAGGLMSYDGLDYCNHYARAASYVDKILKGAHPADPPIELPASFELVINTRSAKGSGITFAPSTLVGADRVIE